MKIIFYNYMLPFRNLLNDRDDIEKFDRWREFRPQCETREPIIIIIPVGVFDLIGLDIRYHLRQLSRRPNSKFLLIGTSKQIEFVLSQNDKFLRNTIDHVILPIHYDALEFIILKKISKFENTE